MTGIFSLEAQNVAYGDHVVLYISPEDLSTVRVERDGCVHNRLGRFKHDDMVGKSFGSQFWSMDGKKHLHLLRPTPELWTRVLPHRTQILYLPDIAFILEMLEIGHGSVVVESGTGSGSFSHSIARAIGKTGHLYTFDFHEARAAQAQGEFRDHGLGEVVTAACRDVCNTGFGLEGVADAVFLDLPSPWLAIAHAKATLKKDRPTRIACFSPCMEQVQRTLPELANHGFSEIEMHEVILRPLEVEEIQIAGLPDKDDGGAAGRKRQLEQTMLMAKHKAEIKGHTSYLYFASLLPDIPSP